jgi:hypothetical protein
MKYMVVHRLCVNIMPFYIRYFREEHPGTNSSWIPKDDCISLLLPCVNLTIPVRWILSH